MKRICAIKDCKNVLPWNRKGNVCQPCIVKVQKRNGLK